VGLRVGSELGVAITGDAMGLPVGAEVGVAAKGDTVGLDITTDAVGLDVTGDAVGTTVGGATGAGPPHVSTCIHIACTYCKCPIAIPYVRIKQQTISAIIRTALIDKVPLATMVVLAAVVKGTKTRVISRTAFRWRWRRSCDWTSCWSSNRRCGGTSCWS
jgi:hypothetical protein